MSDAMSEREMAALERGADTLDECEVCADGTPATVLVNRKWRDGVVDKNIRVCYNHSMNDPSGMYKIYGTADAMTPGGRREVAIKLLCNWFDHRYLAHVLKAHIPVIAAESQKQADEAMEEILELMGVDS